MTPEPIARLLDENAELRPLAARLAYIRRLQRRYRAVAPPALAEASRVCAVDGTIVIVCADSGPVAAALRHLAPRILEALRGPASAARNSSKHPRDQELTSMRVEVQVPDAKPPRRVVARGEMPAATLEKVARGMRESPLREQLERMSARKPGK
jgi:Dna[CI] antecedent DciA-like protein